MSDTKHHDQLLSILNQTQAELDQVFFYLDEHVVSKANIEQTLKKLSEVSLKVNLIKEDLTNNNYATSNLVQ